MAKINPIAEIYASLIIKNLKEISEVPTEIKSDVLEIINLKYETSNNDIYNNL